MGPGCLNQTHRRGILTGADWPLFETFNGTTELKRIGRWYERGCVG